MAYSLLYMSQVIRNKLNFLRRELGMKNKLIALAMMTALSASANASVITLDTTGFGGSTTFDFDLIQFLSETGANSASVTQTDTSGDGSIAGPDAFMEMGGTSVLSFNLDGSLAQFGQGVDGWNIFFDYQVGGMANQDVTGDLQVNFDTLISGSLYAVDTSTNINYGLATFSLLGGDCDIDADVDGTGSVFVEAASSCHLDLTGVFEDGYFTDSTGLDLGQYDDLGKTLGVSYDATVTAINGLKAVYPGGPGSSQTFSVEHTASMEINVPEPTTVAILGLGLLGFAGARRRKS